MAILSQASEIEEGAETRHGTPKGNNSYGEGIVQTTKAMQTMLCRWRKS